MIECIFCKIINGEIPSKKLWEDDYLIAIEDINPIAPIHLLILSKEHVEGLESIQGEHLKTLPECISALTKQFKIDETGFRVVTNRGKEGGQEVDHLHFHLLGGRQLKTMG